MQPVYKNDRDIYPSKIICVGRNYVAHANELNNEVPNEPVIFMKPNSSIGNRLHDAHGGEVLHYEAELCFLVEHNRLSAVGVGIDLTKRETQKALKAKGLPWERAKAFDNSALFSEFIDLEDDLMLAQLGLRLLIDGQVRQSGAVSQMLFKPQALFTFIKNFMRFEEGDILMTGTPEGVGEVNPGALFRAEVIAGDQVLLSAQWMAGR